jgi:hypothetical protein
LYNQKFRAKVIATGDLVPQSSEWTALFTDGTRFPVCRPDGPNFLQKEFFYGKDSKHCLGFQVTSGMDGMVVDLFGGFPGSRHDSHIFRSSMLNSRMSEAQVDRNVQYKCYMDKGYYTDTHVVAAYQVHNEAPPAHLEAYIRIGLWLDID